MKRISRYLVMTLVTAMCLSLSSAAFAGSSCSPGWGERTHKEGKDRFFKELNITPQQREKLDANRAKNEKAVEALHDELRARKSELNDEIGKPTVDKVKVDSITADIKSLMGKLMDYRVADLLSLKEILTPEQFKKMQNRMHEKKAQRDRQGPRHTGI